MMNRLRNERGIALVTALLLTLIALAIVGAVLYMVTQGIQISASSKRYKTALEASNGGLDIFSKDILTQIYTGTHSTQVKSQFSSISLNFFGTYTSCMNHKLTTPTAQWDTTTGHACGSTARIINPKVNYDAMFTLKGTTTATNYTAYAQIVDTVPGNSDRSGLVGQLGSGTGVAGLGSGLGTGSGISPVHTPALFTIEIQGEKSTNPSEKAKLSVLYAY